jgi:hypothetical protein
MPKYGEYRDPDEVGKGTRKINPKTGKSEKIDKEETTKPPTEPKEDKKSEQN